MKDTPCTVVAVPLKKGLLRAFWWLSGDIWAAVKDLVSRSVTLKPGDCQHMAFKLSSPPFAAYFLYTLHCFV